MNPEDRDKILDILCNCDIITRECISFEMNFPQKSHPVIKSEISEIGRMLCDQYIQVISVLIAGDQVDM